MSHCFLSKETQLKGLIQLWDYNSSLQFYVFFLFAFECIVGEVTGHQSYAQPV